MMVLPHYVAAQDAIIDGEIAVLDEKGRPSFSKIQPRIAQTDPNAVAHLSRSTPATFFAFDILYWDGYDLRGAALTERKRALAAVLTPTERIRKSEHFAANGQEMLEAAKQAGLEGIMAKQADSQIRIAAEPLLAEGKGPERAGVHYLRVHARRSNLLQLARARGLPRRRTGPRRAGGDRIQRQNHPGDLSPLCSPWWYHKSPFRTGARVPRKVTWVRPELVCEVAYLEWTPDRQLRAPSFIGMRNDISPREVVVEEERQPEEETAAETPEQRGPLLAKTQKEAVVEIDGRSIKFTNLNKIWWPDEGYTKRDVINYYDAIANIILPHLCDRPLSLKRYPNGIKADYFFQKNAEAFAGLGAAGADPFGGPRHQLRHRE